MLLPFSACSHLEIYPCGCAPVPPPPNLEHELVSDIGDRVFFAFNSAQLSSDDKTTLDRQVRFLIGWPGLKILIAGNADERGTETYNLALGNRRADVTRDYLVAQGIPAARIKTISYGKDRPVAAGHDDPAHQQNRNAITSVDGNNSQE
jgi:peptidoglycan-associated lipoprotein